MVPRCAHTMGRWDARPGNPVRKEVGRLVRAMKRRESNEKLTEELAERARCLWGGGSELEGMDISGDRFAPVDRWGRSGKYAPGNMSRMLGSGTAGRAMSRRGGESRGSGWSGRGRSKCRRWRPFISKADLKVWIARQDLGRPPAVREWHLAVQMHPLGMISAHPEQILVLHVSSRTRFLPPRVIQFGSMHCSTIRKTRLHSTHSLLRFAATMLRVAPRIIVVGWDLGWRVRPPGGPQHYGFNPP